MIKDLDFGINSLRSRANWAKYQLQSKKIPVRGDYNDWVYLGIKSIGMGGIPIQPTKAEALYYKYMFSHRGVTIPNLDLYIEFLDYSERMSNLINLNKASMSTNIDYLSIKSGKVVTRVGKYKEFLQGLGYSKPIFTDFTFDEELDCLPYLLYSHTAMEGSEVWKTGFDEIFGPLKKQFKGSNNAKMFYSALLPQLYEIKYTDTPYQYDFELALFNLPYSSIPVRKGDPADGGNGPIVKPKPSRYCFILSSLYKSVFLNTASPEEIESYKDSVDKILRKDYEGLEHDPNVMVKKYSVPPATTVNSSMWYRYISNTDINEGMVSGDVDPYLYVLAQLVTAYQGYMCHQVITNDLSSCCRIVLPTDIPSMYHELNITSDLIEYAPPLLNVDGLDTSVITDEDTFGIGESLRQLLDTGHSTFSIGVGIDYDDYLESILKCMTKLIYDTDETVTVDYRR